MSTAEATERDTARLVGGLLAAEAACARARAAAWSANSVPNREYIARELAGSLANAKAALDIALEEATKESA